MATLRINATSGSALNRFAIDLVITDVFDIVLGTTQQHSALVHSFVGKDFKKAYW